MDVLIILKIQNVEFIVKIIILYFVLTLSIIAKEQKFEAPIAAQIEARIGSFYQTNVDKMRLDIGNSFDLSKLYESESILVNSGADLMTYTRLRSVGKFKFPVETTDYYFGVNSSIIFKSKDDNYFSSRIRVAHISSHLIDGFSNNGVFNKMPYTYSREFVDVLVAYNSKANDDFNYKVYGGLNTIFSTIPDELNLLEPQIGFDLNYNLYKNKIEFVFGYDIRFLGQDGNYIGSNSLQTGINYLTSETKNIFFGYYYYSGQSMHGLFIKDYDQYHGIGVQLYY